MYRSIQQRYRWGNQSARADWHRKNRSQVLARITYKDAGVDITAGNDLVDRIKQMNPSIGGFGGMFPFGDSYLVAGTDGVGTKLRVAFDMGLHATVGIDLVAMSVNDILTCGAKPLFFLDYFATGRLDIDQAEQVVKGIVDGCQQADCTLLGGETAEMPSFYKDGEYDIAGFAVGAVKKNAVVDGSTVVAGDVVLGLPSTGVHSNGFSLVRKILEVSGTELSTPTPWSDATFGEVLLKPTAVYVKQVLQLLDSYTIKAMCHVTGGGFPENLPRCVPKGLTFRVEKGTWVVPPIFTWLQEAGDVPEAEMLRTFNMGIGYVMVVAPETADAMLAEHPAILRIGSIVEGAEVVVT